MYFFSSDTHFYDDGILLREHRQFKNNKKFLRTVLKIWNKQTTKKDIIYVIGDFFNYNQKDSTTWKKTSNLAKKFKAKIIIVIGNNEERIIEKEFGGDFEAFRQYLIQRGFYDIKKEEFLNIKNEKFYLNHYPVNKKDGYINLFGHVHRSVGLCKTFGFNVGCDLTHFYLLSEIDILNLIDEKHKFWDNDKNVWIN